jgi:hypothetical protein
MLAEFFVEFGRYLAFHPLDERVRLGHRLFDFLAMVVY